MKTVYFSDLHVGDGKSKHLELCRFLEAKEDITDVVIAGDLFDLWVTSAGRAFKEGKYFLDYLYEHFNGHIVYLTGNHDEDLQYVKSLNGIPIKQFHHFNVGGKSAVVCHGHQYDHNFYLEKMSFVAKVNAWAVNRVDKWFSTDVRKWLMSMSEAIQNDPMEKILFTYELVLRQAFTGVHDIVITGHTHSPRIKKFNGLTFINTGDGVQHSTAVVLEENKFSLIDYVQGEELDHYIVGDETKEP
jgi:UDP-2,3-diacylglucosamine pyrophosphatase LpxH